MKAVVAAILLLLFIPGCMVGCGGMALMLLSKPSEGGPSVPAPAPVTNEGQVWGALADRIGKVPTEFQDTDAVVAVSKKLVESGDISSTDRLRTFNSQNKPITDANRGEVINTVRGGGW